MKLGRVRYRGNEYHTVFYPETETLKIYESTFMNENCGIELPMEEVEFLPPVEPRNVFCIAFNHIQHIEELEKRGFYHSPSPEPIFFLKSTNAITAHTKEIILPKNSNLVEFEGELGIIIGRTCRFVKPENASKYILGYSIANDVTARDFQFKDGQWSRAKSIDGFCPLGPWIETSLDPHNIQIKSYLNGEEVQNFNTKEFIFDVFKVVSFLSWHVTLKPHDVILSGSGMGNRSLRHGDTVEIRASSIGSLKNRFLRTL